jgi:hypothetical protein
VKKTVSNFAFQMQPAPLHRGGHRGVRGDGGGGGGGKGWHVFFCVLFLPERKTVPTHVILYA